MRFRWDTKKSELNRQKRGFSHGDLVEMLKGEIVRAPNTNYPHQEIAIGYKSGQLLTVAVEMRVDEEGAFIWIATYRPTSTRERTKYANQIRQLRP